MAASIDFNQDTIYLLNKYFIQPVLTLNTSLTNIDSNIINFNNSSSITLINASILANTSSITRLNTSVTTLNTSVSNLSNYVTNLNTSLSNAIDTVNSTTLTIGGTNGTSTQSYGSALSSGTLNIANSQTNGILNIGTGNNVVRSGAINIATVAGSTCPINILKSDGATTGGSVNIANGALQTTTVNIASGTGTGTVTIGNSSNTVNLNSAVVNVGRFKASGAVTQDLFIEVAVANNNNSIEFHSSGLHSVGSDSRITAYGGTSVNEKGTLELVAETLQMTGNLTLNTGRNITLQPTANYVAPTSDTMLGGITEGTFTLPAFPRSSTADIATITLVKGTYMVFFGFQIDGNPYQCWIELVGSAIPALNSIPSSYRFGNSVLISTQNLQISGSFPYSVTTAGTVVLRLQLQGTISNIPVYKYQAVRIA
jgi:hypothetical protein